MCSRITVAIETKMCLAIPWALGRPEPCPAGRQHHRTLLRSWRELRRKVAAARQGDPASNRAGGSITTRYSDPMLRPANTRRQTEIPPVWTLTSGHLVIRVVGLGSTLTSARTSGYRRPGYTGPVSARQPQGARFCEACLAGLQSLTSPACRLNDPGGSTYDVPPKPTCLQNEEARATWRA
jgi:hypothetical protein